MSTTINYGPDFLTIRIPTTAPGATHCNLLRGITDLLQYYVDSTDKRTNSQGVSTVLELQQTLTPTEEQLQRAFR